MHCATCPICGTRVELDFLPVAGQVWCPKCQKLFSLSVEPPKQDEDSRRG
jgi:hypothetical protein